MLIVFYKLCHPFLHFDDKSHQRGGGRKWLGTLDRIGYMGTAMEHTIEKVMTPSAGLRNTGNPPVIR